ncbi:FAD-dependent monooxygenase [Streptomyces sp. NPDC047022]|uniref:FAD-dependent monooxygenase n=1 Tax=Streptomyces sp. NPDC047022 TaxID=3155737 RepID=UPI0033F2EFAC
MTTSTGQIDVLVVGAGPTGLACAILLGRAGIRTHVVARHTGTATHPKAHVVNARSMEILRQWGLSAAVAEAALPPDRGLGMGWMTRMAGRELGRLMVDDDPQALHAALNDSSEILRSCPQDVLEPLLLKAATASSNVTVEFSTEVLTADQDGEGVTTRARVVRDGGERLFRSAYVIAADGARSTIRRHLGIANDEFQATAHMIGVHFTADLADYQSERPFLLWWIVNPDTQGVFIALDGRHRWTYLFGYDPTRNMPTDFTGERCARIVRDAVGAPGLDVRVHGVFPWRMETAIAHRFRDRRVFLAGDAAHRFPPTGGFGMNTGIQDAHNLAWKLAHVLRGTAGEGLLDTYESERRPVAVTNALQSKANAEGLAPTGALLADPESLRAVEDEESAEGEVLRAAIAAAIPAQRDQALFNGQTFGYLYESAAIVDDGTEAPVSSVSVYRPTARPGARAPHLWLTGPDGDHVALVDATGDGFAVLAGPRGDAWEGAAAVVRERYEIDVAVLRVGPDCPWTDKDGEWAALYGVGAAGCVLIRPDGHVGMRHADEPGDATGVLCAAVAQILARETSPLTVG